MSDASTDFELLDRWGIGDRRAGDQLFERHFDALLRFFQNKVRQGVEDLVQQTLLACVEGRGRFRGDASFKTYLFQTARYQLYAYYRANQRGRELGGETSGIADFGTSPSGALARKQEGQWLLEALRRIPPHHQIVLELSLWEDMTGCEIAAILEIPEGTVRSRLRLAASRLRQELQASADYARKVTDIGDDLQSWAQRVRESLGGGIDRV